MAVWRHSDRRRQVKDSGADHTPERAPDKAPARPTDRLSAERGVIKGMRRFARDQIDLDVGNAMVSLTMQQCCQAPLCGL